MRQAVGRSAGTVRDSSASSGRSTRWNPRHPRAGGRCPRRPRRPGRPVPGERARHLAYPEQARQRGQCVGDRQAVQQPVDGADPERIAGRVHQEDEAVVPGARARVLLLEPQVGRPSVVAVRDQRLVTEQVRLDLRALGGIGDRPQPVAETVLRGRGEQRRAVDGPLDDGGRARAGVPVAAVGQQQGFQMGGGGAHQIGPVLDDMRHDVLVREHDTVGGPREREGADHTPLQDAVAALLVHVQRRLVVRREHALREPVVQGGGGLCVAGGDRAGLRQDQPDDVVRVRRLQVQQPVGPHHHVVRGRGHRGEAADPLGDVPQPTERNQPQSPVRRASCVHPRIVCGVQGCAMIGGEAGDEERGT